MRVVAQAAGTSDRPITLRAAGGPGSVFFDQLHIEHAGWLLDGISIVAPTIDGSGHCLSDPVVEVRRHDVNIVTMGSKTEPMDIDAEGAYGFVSTLNGVSSRCVGIVLTHVRYISFSGAPPPEQKVYTLTVRRRRRITTNTIAWEN